jgi:hypothetical protein
MPRINNQEIDHSQGHAFLHNGEVFYSPNSSRRIVIPDRPGPSSRYRFHQKDAFWERFHDPQWWTQEYCFLSFVPLRPSFEGDTFGSLRDILSFVIGPDSDDRFHLREDKAAEWIQLQDWLFHISALLEQSINVYPSLKPIPPSLIGFQKRFTSLRSARIRATTSRDWFVIWMGLLSFKIAAVSDWFGMLAEKDIPQIWLNDFGRSTVCNFSENCPRAGIILDWLNTDKNLKKPPVEWFTSHHVPVWYPWTRDHINACSKPQFAYLRPPVEVIQMATTLSPIPLPSQSRQHLSSQQPATRNTGQPATSNTTAPTAINAGAHMSQKEFNAARNAYLKTKPWAPFFEARAQRNQAQLQRETDQQRQTRLNRERNPPTVSAEVYEWDWSEEDPFVLVRTRMSINSRVSTLEDYERSQRRYDSFKNVWDVCQWFDLDDRKDGNDDDLAESWGGSHDWSPHGSEIEEDDDDYDIAGEQAAHAAYISNRCNELSTIRNAISWPTTPFRSKIEMDLTANLKPFELLQHLQIFQGFVPPLRTDTSSWTRQDWDDAMKTIGWHNKPPLKDFEAIVIQFVKDWLSTPSAPENSDLNLNNYRAIIPSELRAAFRYIPLPEGQFLYGKNTFLYALRPGCLKNGIDCPYSIILTNPRDTVLVYRLLGVSDFTAISLCEFLLENGIAFRTLQYLPHIASSRTLNNDETLLPMRLSDYQFESDDYEAYIRHRAQFLTSPRGRAALLRGGIVARIAREHIAIDSALLGPSSAVMVHRLGMHVTNGGLEFWDDDLTENEIGIICGVHRCFTGMSFGNYI